MKMKVLYWIAGILAIVVAVMFFNKQEYTPLESDLKYNLYVLGQEKCALFNLEFNCEIYTFPDTPEFNGSPNLQGTYLRGRVELSRRLFTTHTRHLNGTFLHEVAHYINNELNGTGKEHDSAFHIINNKIGGIK